MGRLLLPPTNYERFWMHVVKGNGPDDCWEWTGTITVEGYSKFWGVEQRSIPAHKFSFELANGPLTGGEVPDHKCRNRSCVNPKHMERETHAVNILLGIGPTAVNATKIYCWRGHLLDGDNLIPRKDGHRECRTCVELRNSLRRVPPDVKRERAKIKGRKVSDTLMKKLTPEQRSARVFKSWETRRSK